MARYFYKRSELSSELKGMVSLTEELVNLCREHRDTLSADLVASSLANALTRVIIPGIYKLDEDERMACIDEISSSINQSLIFNIKKYQEEEKEHVKSIE